MCWFSNSGFDYCIWFFFAGKKWNLKGHNVCSTFHGADVYSGKEVPMNVCTGQKTTVSSTITVQQILKSLKQLKSHGIFSAEVSQPLTIFLVICSLLQCCAVVVSLLFFLTPWTLGSKDMQMFPVCCNLVHVYAEVNLTEFNRNCSKESIYSPMYRISFLA